MKLFHLILSLISVLLTSAEEFQCSSKEAKTCICTREPHQFDLLCPSKSPTVLIHYKPESFSTDKDSPFIKLLWLPQPLQSNVDYWNNTRILINNLNLNLNGIKTFTARRSPGLPKFPFIQMFQPLQMDNLKNFILNDIQMEENIILEKHYFKGLEKIQMLDLSSNQLFRLPENLFNDFSELTWLDLKKNYLQIPRGIFSSLIKLDVLELSHNNLTNLEPGIFRNLTKLRLLNLWGNRLQNLTRLVFKDLTNLEQLDLSYNNFNSLVPDLFADLTQLKAINLQGNSFSSLPRGLFLSNTQLERIQINRNGRALQLPQGFLQNLYSLKDVKLNSCGLSQLPPDMLAGVSNMTNLTLANNSLTEIPDDLFKDTVNLLSLDLSENELTELKPGLFKNLRKLVYLSLEFNNLTTIKDGTFQGLYKLEVLKLNRNLLKTFGDKAFTDLNNLKEIYLSYNYISDFGIDGFYGQNSYLYACNNLDTIELSYNRISVIYFDWKTRVSLKKLNLRHNAFTYLEFEDIKVLGREPIIDLTDNLITEVNLRNAERIIAEDVALESQSQRDQLRSRRVRVVLQDNHIKCDCNAFDLVRFAQGAMNKEVVKRLELDTAEVDCDGTPLEQVSLERLLCKVNTCPPLCQCYVRTYDAALIVNCNSGNLTELPLLVSSNQSIQINHTILNVSHNKIKQLPEMAPDGYADLTSIDLSHNHLGNLTHFNLSPSLKDIRLDHNHISRISDSLIEVFKSPSIRTISLDNNPWICDCLARDLTLFLQNNYNKVVNRENITCLDGAKLIEMTVGDLCPSSNWIIAVGSSTAVLGLLLGAAAALYYKHQKAIKVWLYAHNFCLWFVTEEELDKDKQYDAFVSYSHQDEDFVVNELVPGLEHGGKYKLCLHYRDWIVGDFIPQQILRSVEESRRTIIVLSPAFVESVWGRLEFRAAHQQALNEGRARLIVILYGDIGSIDKLDDELKSYLSLNTYVKWGDTWFWEKIRYALPHPKKSNSQALTQTKQDKSVLLNGSNTAISGNSVPPSKDDSQLP